MARWCALVAAAVVILTADASAFAQTALYACSGDTATAERVGVTLCNAGPTDALTSRVEDDNLQLRDGALIVELDEGEPSDEEACLSHLLDHLVTVEGGYKR